MINKRGGQPRAKDTSHLGPPRQLVDDVDQAAAAAGYVGSATVTSRPASITWAFPSPDVTASTLILATRLVADRLNPGG